MGTYRPYRARKRRSVADTLREAEHEHFLDCPNADFLQRLGALTLDIIFYTLIVSALRNLELSAVAAIPSLTESFGMAELSPIFLFWLPTVIITLKCLGLYYYYLWPLRSYGGSPAKLLLGLRIVNERTGEPPDLPQILLREIIGKPLSLVTVFGAALALVAEDKRALHDRISNTVVKRIHGV